MNGITIGDSATARPRLSVAKLVSAARDLLVAGGAGAVVIREVARSLGVAPSALYKHVTNRDQLLTLLVADLYNELSQTCEVARDACPATAHRARLLAASSALRVWARSHPAEFDFLFGYPIPGYAAPSPGPSQQAGQRFGRLFVEIFTAAWAEGRLRSRQDHTLPGDIGRQLRDHQPAAGQPMRPGEMYPLVMGFQRMLGLVIVEISGQLGWALDDPAELTEEQLRHLVDELLLPDL